MRPVEDIVITIDDILAMKIDGLPTTERGLRRHAKDNGWPVVYAENGKYLILADAIPEPFGYTIRFRLSPLFRVHENLYALKLSERRFAGQQAGWETAEARLAILFEIYRRAAFLSQDEAIKGFVAEAVAGDLNDTLSEAVQRAVLRGYRTRPGHFAHSVHERARDGKSGTFYGMRLPKEPTSSCISRGSIFRWITLFRKHGVKGLFPGFDG